MAIAAKHKADLDQVVRLKVSWSAYEALVASLGDHSHAKLTYDGEILKIVSRGTTHNFVANTIAQMIDELIIAWQLPLTAYRSATLKTKPEGFEADNTFYLQAKTRLRDPWNIEISVDPPPDLVNEIDISNSSDEKAATTYANLGVPEVWRYTLKTGFAGYKLTDGEYRLIETSNIIDGLRLAEIADRLEKAKPGNTAVFLSEWRQWAQDHQHLYRT